MKKQNLILSTALAAVFSASTAFAEAEVTGKIVHESAQFTESGTNIGAASSHGKDVFKTETTAKIYVDGEINEISEGSTYHVELQAFTDGKAISNYDSNESYTQRDALREAYIDTEYEDWSIRAGKQQVVWGTADGMKLLDAINPTDYSEMAQNQMEDSRIPVWMLNAERDVENGGNVQFVVSQAKGNKIAGLNASGDQGAAFVMKGVDTITGKANGFLNIAPEFGQVAGFFYNSGDGMAVRGYQGSGNAAAFSDAVTVDGYANTFGLHSMLVGTVGYINSNTGAATNLVDADSLNTTNPTSTFEYVADTAFGTFEDFRGMTSTYRKSYPDAEDANIGFRYKNNLDSGLNYSLNFLNHYDSNPSVDMHWEDASDGTKLSQIYATDGSNVGCLSADGSTCQWGGDFDNPNTSTPDANLVFVESLNKINTFGGSFDTSIETESLGAVVLRGEATYDKDVETPVVDRNKMAIGNLVGGLTMRKGDRFKYVLGADVTVMTNMMVSAQFIQDRNLDYIDTNTDSSGTACGSTTNCGVYSADMATIHLSNNLNQAEKNKEFYSLFFSKPFGASGEHRWNNIFMFEENGGKWNRLDAEFSIDDDTQVTAEYNKYWGDANTQFGQLEKSSNVQVGFKYSF